MDTITMSSYDVFTRLKLYNVLIRRYTFVMFVI